MSEERSQALDHFYNYLQFGGDNFHSLLFRLLQKADSANFARLQAGFPQECFVYQDWYTCESDQEFWKREREKGFTSATSPKPATQK